MAEPQSPETDTSLQERPGEEEWSDPPKRTLWRRLRWPLMLAGISGGVGALLSFGLTSAGVG